jgi:hypothetical protein
MSRADFSPKTREIIARRSGYRCSFLGCNRTTIGPGASADEAAGMGVAAHVFAASSGGPRGTGGLSKNELTLPENGIWLCANHSRIVDANRGKKYPPELLLSYKAQHEAGIAREVQGVAAAGGWFQELCIRNSPIFARDTIIRLAKLTLVVGGNESGKTAVCEWLAGFADIHHISRWRHPGGRGYPIDVNLRYYDPEGKTLGMLIDDTGRVRFSDNGFGVPVSTHPMKILYPKPVHDDRGLNDLQLVASWLAIDEVIVMNLCDEIQSSTSAWVRNIRFEPDEDSVVRLRADVHGTAPGLTLSCLSAGESQMVLLELATVAARAYARHVPTMLILDGAMTVLDRRAFEHQARHLADANSLFQTIVVVPTVDMDVAELEWLGWEVVRTQGRPPNVVVEQSIRP